MPKYSFTIDGQTFGSKAAVKSYVKQYIHSQYADNVAISADHLRFMLGLLRYHPESDQKIGLGVVKIWIAQNVVHPTRGFFLERVDGTTTDFSYLQCVEPASPERDFREACRRAVKPVVIQFRVDAFSRGEVVCPVRSVRLDKNASHVDHEPPNTFKTIVDAFIREKSVDILTVKLVHDDNDCGSRFADAAFESKWLEFHNSRAKLRVISREANLSDVKAS